MNISFKKLPKEGKKVLVKTPYTEKIMTFTKVDLEHIVINKFGTWFLGERLISYKYL